MTTQSDAILDRLNRLAMVTLDVRDVASLRTDIDDMLRNGWTADEIVEYCRNNEAIDPSLDEATALRRMKNVTIAVIRRLNGA